MTALLASRAARLRAEALVVAVAVPFVFLHPHYQPSLHAGRVAVDLTDLAILAIVLAAARSGLREGWAPLRGARTIWLPLALFCALLVASLGWARHLDPTYGLANHLTSAAKYLEYVLLAPAVPLALRTRDDRRAFLWALALWSGFLTLVGILQFLGVLKEFEGYRPQQREPSYIGIHDLGAVSGATLTFAFVALTAGRLRRLGRGGGSAGALGVVVAAAQDAVIGMGLSAVAVWALARRRGPVSWRRTLALAALVAAVAVASSFLRTSAIGAFLQFLGFRKPQPNTAANVQTYSQRTVLAYIGYRIWLRQPLLGVGFEASQLPATFEPVLPAAHRRFPHVAPASFPSRQHEWGVQNGIVQALSDFGIVGFLLLAWTFVAAFLAAGVTAVRGPPELAAEAAWTCGTLLVGLLVFTGTGLIPGVAVDALLWLAIGYAVALRGTLTAGG